MTDLNNQFLQLLGEMREEITSYKNIYDTEYSSALSQIAFLEGQLHQGIVNEEIIDHI
jgi:hypothetical protein